MTRRWNSNGMDGLLPRLCCCSPLLPWMKPSAESPPHRQTLKAVHARSPSLQARFALSRFFFSPSCLSLRFLHLTPTSSHPSPRLLLQYAQDSDWPALLIYRRKRAADDPTRLSLSKPPLTPFPSPQLTQHGSGKGPS